MSRENKSNEDDFIYCKLQLDVIGKRLHRNEKFGDTKEVDRLRKKESEIMTKIKKATEEIDNSAKKACRSNIFYLIHSSENRKKRITFLLSNDFNYFLIYITTSCYSFQSRIKILIVRRNNHSSS